MKTEKRFARLSVSYLSGARELNDSDQNDVNEDNDISDDKAEQAKSTDATGTVETTETDEQASGEQAETEVADVQSAVYIGRWRGLVSNTNWEKGRVIAEWRQALVEADADSSEYSDDAWSRRVGGITPQHVGRLRRVHERFGADRGSFEGLFWSHFHAAIDWDDAEMWLEGAVQNGWSVSQLRRQRWETLDGDVAEPQDAEIVSTETNEDIDFDESKPIASNVESRLDAVEGFNKEERRDEEDEDDADYDDGMVATADAPAEPVAPIRPFEGLPELPDDLADAFDGMKLAILRHRVNDWSEVSLDDVLVTLDALKQLAAAPTEGSGTPAS